MISKKNLSIIIVSFASDDVIFDCIETIDKEIDVIVIENSNNIKLKKKLENKFKNVTCFLNNLNSGMGAGNNYGLSKINTEFALILNPDVLLEKSTLSEIYSVSKEIDKFSIIAPIHSNKDYPNFRLSKFINKKEKSNVLDVISVDGYAMLLNIKRISKVLNIKNSKLFDENIFMYLENNDLCKRLIAKKEKIFVIKSSKIKHLGAKGVSEKFRYQVELSRNWHWAWSRFYFKKKHYGFLNAFFTELPKSLSSLIKLLYYLISNNKKKIIYLFRLRGFFCSLFGRPSNYRPKINISELEN